MDAFGDVSVLPVTMRLRLVVVVAIVQGQEIK